MSLPVNELTHNDYLIIKYASRFDTLEKTQIEKHFHGRIKALDYHLSRLSTPDYQKIQIEHIHTWEACYLESLKDDVYKITPLGLSAIQEYVYNIKLKLIAIIIRDIFIPIGVAILTSIATTGILQLL